MDYENIYNVLARNEKLKFDAMVNLGEDYDDKKKVVEFAKRNFNQTYREALKLVTDPERKIVQVYEDDVKHFLNKYREASYNRDGLSSVIFDFIQENGLNDKFYEFLQKNKDREMYPTDIDDIMRDYAPLD